MKGKDEIIEVLQEVLSAELTAVNQYFIHARMNENWGYKKLAWKQKPVEARMDEEMLARIKGRWAEYGID